MPEWEADIEVDEALVQALLREQFPELDASSARLLAEGWDNAVWVIEEEWAFRFPRRAVAVPLLERELAALPRLAPLLPVPVPVPVYVGRSCERYPWPFFGSALLPGADPSDVEKWRPVLMQDFDNMSQVQRGMRSRGFEGARLNLRQERAILLMHQEIDRYLNQ